MPVLTVVVQIQSLLARILVAGLLVVALPKVGSALPPGVAGRVLSSQAGFGRTLEHSCLAWFCRTVVALVDLWQPRDR